MFVKITESRLEDACISSRQGRERGDEGKGIA